MTAYGKIYNVILNQDTQNNILVKKDNNLKLCKSCLKKFFRYIQNNKQAVQNKKIVSFFNEYGYPQDFLHNTNFLNCEECRNKQRDVQKKYRNNTDKKKELIKNLEKIFLEIENDTFKKHGGGKVAILWRLSAKKYAKSQNKSELAFLDQMKLYKEYRENKINDRFYGSKKWRDLRNEAINVYGKVCMKCQLPDLEGNNLHCDHILPRSLFPQFELDIKNLQILCLSCNASKSNKGKIDYRPNNWEKLIDSSL